jgi:hypothetical protein
MSKFTLVNLSVFFVVFVTQGEHVSSPAMLCHFFAKIACKKMRLIRICVTFGVEFDVGKAG